MNIRCALLLCCGLTLALPAKDVVPNPSFERGTGKTEVTGWKPSAPSCAWKKGSAAKGTHYISVSGNGSDNTYWRSDLLPLQPGKLYRVSFQARSERAAGGTAVTGPVFCNRDIGRPQTTWEAYSTVFLCPHKLDAGDAWLRFGQWHVNGTIDFDDVRLAPVQAIHERFGSLTLGNGEQIEGTQYAFNAPFNAGGNHCRPLVLARCHFNTNRWVFGADSEVRYRHRVGTRRQLAAKLEVSIGYYAGGQLLAEVSVDDGAHWRSLGTQDGSGTLEAAIPDDLLPAREVLIRLRARAKKKVGAATSDPGSFQINAYRYTATLDGAPLTARGATRYVEIEGPERPFNVTLLSLGKGLPGATNTVLLEIDNQGKRSIQAAPVLRLTQPGVPAATFRAKPRSVPPGITRLRCPYDVPATGSWKFRISLGKPLQWSATGKLFVPSFYDTSYGAVLPGSSDSVGLWTASSGWKVPRPRSMPKARAPALRLRAAANEAEACQLIVRPRRKLLGLRLSAGDFLGPNNQRLPASSLDILRVAYIPVTRRTDATGVLADWPDPLPPLHGPLDLEAGINHPFWIRIRVPAGTPAGIYRGSLTLEAETYRARVPVQIEVYGFELPRRMTCQTAFGFSVGNLWRYQRPKTLAQRRQLLDLYWQNFAAHHISPYNPAPLDPFQVQWPALQSWQGGIRDRDVTFSGKASLRLSDTNPKGNVAAHYGEKISIPKAGFRFRFRYRTKNPGERFLVSFNHYDGDDQWMSGRNNDMKVVGDGSWQQFDRTITHFPKGARRISVSLWATLYANDGHPTGTVWIDDLTLVDLDRQRNVAPGGEFEPVDPKLLTPSFSWDAWDKAVARGIDELGFTTFRLPIMGLGGGTFHSRREPTMLGYGENTPEYASIMKTYLAGVEAHLRAKGWLDEAFVYWFDEPDPKDYAFVMNGFAKLRRWAPGLRRMLTEQVEKDLIGGPNLWCPVSPQFDPDQAEARRREGEHFWWYICTGPKAPYCTLFIDHPGTELRVWLWQTWKRKIEGILVWETNYWTSPCAYPDADKPQNPYLDPMGWVSGYDTPAGTKRAWGNGDGRFVYPPLAAADGNPEKPVIEGPVDSIRWEMLRDGIEDYEYFVMLQRLLRQVGPRLSPEERNRYRDLLTVPEDVSTDMTHFTTDPAPLEKRRHQLGQAISRLTTLAGRKK